MNYSLRMRDILLISLLILGFWCCSEKDDDAFDVSVSRENITFKATPGGAIMYYNLAGHEDIFFIRARYHDVLGQEVTVDGSYLNDSLILVGFNEAQQNIPIRVSFLNDKREESVGMELSFNTEDSAPVAFFDHVQVLPGWNGFQLIYKSPVATGYAHVFYLGENPKTHESDTLLVETILILEGCDTLSFAVPNEGRSNTIIVATEDFRGHRVKQKVWENVESYAIEKYPSENITLLDPCGIVVNSVVSCIAPKYLFDGDSKVMKRFEMADPEKQSCVFGAGPGALGKYWVLDLGKEQIIGKLRMYSPYRYGIWMGWKWDANHLNKIPNEVTVYGSNDNSSWVKLGYFYQSPLNTGWAEDSWMNVMEYSVLEGLSPVYVDIDCIALQQAYRYVKMLVHDTFYDDKLGMKPENPDGYVIMSELEVYVKK